MVTKQRTYSIPLLYTRIRVYYGYIDLHGRTIMDLKGLRGFLNRSTPVSKTFLETAGNPSTTFPLRPLPKEYDNLPGTMLVKREDAVKQPKHYVSHPSGVEAITITQHYNFNVGNAIKYLWRGGLKKNNSLVQDLRKARAYIDFELKRISDEEKATSSRNKQEQL